jgi:hypothetical protein
VNKEDITEQGIRIPGLKDNSTLELLSFKHLESLEFTFSDDQGEKYTGWAIYAIPPDEDSGTEIYKPVIAPGEGYSCVDDVARIAKMYLMQYEKTGSEESLYKAKEALRFVMYVAAGDGLFYNFIDKKGVINKTGKTSEAVLNWWTARLFHALGKGIRVLKNIEPEFTEKLTKYYNLSMDMLKRYRDNPDIPEKHQKFYEILGIKPGTLVAGNGAITASFVLGLLDRWHVDKDPQYEELITDYCDSLVKMRETSPGRYPFYNLHYNVIGETSIVHLYGNRQVKALAEAGKIFGNKNWIESAEAEANLAYPRIISSGLIPYAFSPDPEIFPQIMYSVETIIANLIAVYRVTNHHKYAVLAGLFAAWIFGENVFETPMAIFSDGRFYDGIMSSGININSGAESVIEGLVALLEIDSTPAVEYLHFKSGRGKSVLPKIITYKDFKIQSAQAEGTSRVLSGGVQIKVLKLNPMEFAEIEYFLPNPGEYHLFLTYQNFGASCPCDLLSVVNGNPQKLLLLPSRDHLHYQTIFLGKIMLHTGGSCQIYLKNEDFIHTVNISSMTIQPDLQKRTWERKNYELTMVVNSVPGVTPARIPVGQEIKIDGEHFFISANEMTLNLSTGNWFLTRKKNLSGE